MKLFWKIFYSVVLVTTVLFCISGHILLGEFFRTTLDEEINAGVNLNTIYNTSIKTAVTKSGKAASLEEGVRMAEKIIDDGLALKKLEQFKEESQK